MFFFSEIFQIWGGTWSLGNRPTFFLPKTLIFGCFSKIEKRFFMNILKNQTFFLKIFSIHVLKKNPTIFVSDNFSNQLNIGEFN